jgi:hypothetical protein
MAPQHQERLFIRHEMVKADRPAIQKTAASTVTVSHPRPAVPIACSLFFAFVMARRRAGQRPGVSKR